MQSSHIYVGYTITVYSYRTIFSVSTARGSQPSSSGRVLTDAVLEMQTEVINSNNEVAKELGEIKTVLTEINCTMREFLNKSCFFHTFCCSLHAMHHFQTLAHSSSIWLKCLGMGVRVGANTAIGVRG